MRNDIGGGIYYLATPYSRYPKGIYAAYDEACWQSSILLKAGIHIFCPIAHTHGPAIVGDIDPTIGNDLWMKLDHEFINVCRGIIVCQMDGWEVSTGVTAEIKEFRRQGKPVIYMIPGSVPEVFIPQHLQPKE